MNGKTLEAAAAAAGMCERTARRWRDGPLPSASKPPRTWRTRPDPFAEVWASEVVPRLAADAEGRLQALTLFDWVCERYPDRFQPGQVRTFQRRVRDWRAQHGPEVEAYFEQTAIPGREGALDFTEASDLIPTLDAIHLSRASRGVTASGHCSQVATHDTALVVVARAFGFDVRGT